MPPCSRGLCLDPLGEDRGSIIFRRLAAPEGPHMRRALLVAALECRPLAVLQALDTERCYLPSGKSWTRACPH